MPGNTILEKRRYMQEQFDFFRKILMWEPRGHADMYGAIPVKPVTEDGDVGVLFLHNEGFSTMCGHGVIALATVLVELGRTGGDERTIPIRMDTPAGRVEAFARRESGRVTEVSFRNVPSFVLHRDREVEVPGIGRVAVRCGLRGGLLRLRRCRGGGGAPRSLGRPESHRPGPGRQARRGGERPPSRTPTRRTWGSFYGTIFTGPAEKANHHSRNVCIFADGEVDRSPTGHGGEREERPARGPWRCPPWASPSPSRASWAPP